MCSREAALSGTGPIAERLPAPAPQTLVIKSLEAAEGASAELGLHARHYR